MSNQETVEVKEEDLVEVIIKVPKSLVKVVEDQNYFAFDKQYFFEASIRSLIGSIIGEWDQTDIEGFYNKYGREVDRYFVPGQFIE